MCCGTDILWLFGSPETVSQCQTVTHIHLSVFNGAMCLCCHVYLKHIYVG